MLGPVCLLHDGRLQNRGPVNAQYSSLQVYAYVTPQANRLAPAPAGGTNQVAVAVIYNNSGQNVMVRFGETELGILAGGQETLVAPAHTQNVQILDGVTWHDLTGFPVGQYCD